MINSKKLADNCSANNMRGATTIIVLGSTNCLLFTFALALPLTIISPKNVDFLLGVNFSILS